MGVLLPQEWQDQVFEVTATHTHPLTTGAQKMRNARGNEGKRGSSGETGGNGGNEATATHEKRVLSLGET